MQDERKYALKQRRAVDSGYQSNVALLGSKNDYLLIKEGAKSTPGWLWREWKSDFGLKCVTATSLIQNKVWQMEIFLSKASSV